MKVVSGLYYTKDHEWVKVEGKTAYVGVTDFAQSSLGSIVYVELPELEEEYEAEDSFGTIESVKAASDMLMPVSGTVLEVNEDLDNDPSLVNTDAYENWIIKISLSDESELDELMNAEEYEAYCNEERIMMFPYIPNTEQDEAKMLAALGIDSVDRLFDDIPDQVKLKRRLNLCAPLSEAEVSKHIRGLAGKNTSTNELVCFLGAGAYDHAIPSVVHHLINRSEFYTAYTPYQPEISQGTLQAIFEYQTMIANLTGMEVSNASMYDGASATAEAAMLAAANQKGDTVLISETVHPEVREVVKTYMRFNGVKVVEIPSVNGVTDIEALKNIISKDAVCVIVQSPNFLGNIEDYTEAVEITHENKALFVMNVDPISMGVLKTPGEYGADLAVGEGQVLGNALNFGGPYLGFMAASNKQMRKLPGRIVGQTVDLDGKRAFTLTLQAREQHIRREKATSNICSNQALNALCATIYLSALGKEGLKEVAVQCIKKSHYAKNKLIETGKFRPVYDAPFFKEFVLETDIEIGKLNKQLADKGFLGGYDLGKAYPSDKNRVLFCVTEKRTKEEIDAFVKAMEEITW